MGELTIDRNLLTAVSHRLELREPNRGAVESVILEASQHYDVESKGSPFECVVDSATGVGKTYVLAGLLEYLAGTEEQMPVRNFLVVAPGRTILRKTIANFTRGNPKSLMGKLRANPQLITVDNFNSPASARSMADPSITKIFVLTVQSLLPSKSGASSAVHDFVEGLGGSLYKHLSQLDDLVVFADEHHCYLGPAFSKAIRELNPELLVGLTATPDKKDKTPVVYVYPLAAAIADKLVKRPIIVGRRDDAKDDRTKLSDGIALLKRKEVVLAAYCKENNLPKVNPVMLVIAKDIDEAEEFRTILESGSFEGGAAVGATLLVHSALTGEDKEDALAALEAVEDPDSPVRVILSVGMLKEGWDVKNVYVIASMRASVSDVLTEQTLGRGMRLPFGKHTGIEFLDAVEVLAHERYSTLLAKKDVLNEAFVDHYTRAIARANAHGVLEVVRITETTSPISIASEPAVLDPHHAPNVAALSGELPAVDTVVSEEGFTLVDDLTYTALTQRTIDQATSDDNQYLPLPDRPNIVVPRLVAVSKVTSKSLNSITDLSPFTLIGTALATEGDTDLVRTVVDAHRDGVMVKMDTHAASDNVKATLFDVPLEESRDMLISRILAAPGVPSRPNELGAAERITDEVIEAMGSDARIYLSVYFDRCAARVVAAVNDRMKAQENAVQYDDDVTSVNVNRVRTSTREEISSREATFDKARAFNSWKKNLYSHSWFDTSTERDAAVLIDDAATVNVWARLHLNEVPIAWTQRGRKYNPDFVVVEEVDGHTICWLVETKQDRMMDSDEVLKKREAALIWINTVNSAGPGPGTWRYLLVGEQDVKDSTSWTMLTKFGA